MYITMRFFADGAEQKQAFESGDQDLEFGKKCPFCGAAMPEESHFCLSCFSVCPALKSETEPEPVAARTKAAVIWPGRKCLAERIVSAALALVLVVGMVLGFTAAEKSLPLQMQSPNAGTADGAATEPAAQTASPQTGEAALSQDTGEGPLAERTPTLSLPQQMMATVVGQALLGDTDAALPGTQTPAGAIGDSSGSVDIPVAETPGTETPGTGTSNSVEPSEEEVDSEDCWVYENEAGSTKYVKITKYTGNATKVTVPAVLGGKPVARITRDTFADNDRITEITFESDERQVYLWVDSGCMTDLPALKVVRLPDTDLGVSSGFADNCPSLENIEVDSRQYLFENGALYYWSSKEWRIRYYAPACKNETLTVPSWCAGLEAGCALEENPYLKRINLHKNVNFFPSNYAVNDALEYIDMEAGSDIAFSVDGVLFAKNSSGRYSSSCYPPGKRDKIFKLPENVTLNISVLTCPYLEEIWIPKSSGVSSPDSLYFRRCFTNLKVIHLQKGHSYEERCKSTFTGITEMY